MHPRQQYRSEIANQRGDDRTGNNQKSCAPNRSHLLFQRSDKGIIIGEIVHRSLWIRDSTFGGIRYKEGRCHSVSLSSLGIWSVRFPSIPGCLTSEMVWVLGAPSLFPLVAMLACRLRRTYQE
jgi:hypothetical protein